VTGTAWIRQPKQPPRELETAVTGDEWIRQPTQPCRELENINELMSQVTRGFDSPYSPLGSKKLLSRVTRGFYTQDSPLGSEKSSTNCCLG
jgi:hypothetical protein